MMIPMLALDKSFFVSLKIRIKMKKSYPFLKLKIGGLFILFWNCRILVKSIRVRGSDGTYFI